MDTLRTDWQNVLVGFTSDARLDAAILRSVVRQMAIPKVAHWIWLSPDIPRWVNDNIELFRSLHRDWSIRIWQELPDEFPQSLREIIDSVPWYSCRSDLFRYWILARHGGVFLDTDIVPLRSFDSLLNHSFFLAPCLPEGHTRPHLNCALMGSLSESPEILSVLDECVRFAAKGLPPRRIAYGPDMLTRLFAGPVATNATILPSHYFYAIPDRTTAHRFWHADTIEREQLLNPFRAAFTDESEPYAMHLWGVDGSSQRQVPCQSATVA